MEGSEFMNTRVPKITPPEVTANERPGWITEIRKYKVITPLYGGGEETQKADSITTVRASEVRGHLRFWWRATRGGQFGDDLKKMREAEEKIWGSSGEKGKPGPSIVNVAITTATLGVIDRPFEVVASRTGGPQVRGRSVSKVHPYAAFPLQPEQRDARIGMETKPVYLDTTFTLEVRYKEEVKQDVDAALWSWEQFGGIGARTRRGFGALQCLSINNNIVIPPTVHGVKDYLIKNIKNYVVESGEWPKGVPHLSTNLAHLKIIDKRVDSISTWYGMIDAFKNFRQFRRDNERKGQGRSYWPEPEKIRKITRQRLPKHQPIPIQSEHFPRAKFGLPIIFHFKDANRRAPLDPNFDPRDTTLQGANNDRLASPLILRPLVCSIDNTSVGLAVILEWSPLNSNEPYTPPNGLILKDAPDNPAVQSDLEPEEVRNINYLQGNPDVLQAFLDYLK
jgi:CRISPR-associated protein Cmr1